MIMRPIKWIADLGANHNQNFDRLCALTKEAKRIGCHAVKLQLYDERLYRDFPLKAKMTDIALPIDFISAFKDYCSTGVGIEFHCTPFNLEAVDILEPYVNGFKIGSYEILYHDLIRKCGATGKSTAISTGGADTSEIIGAVGAYNQGSLNAGAIPRLRLYQCSPFYPADKWHINFENIHTMRSMYPKIPVGYSDHTVHPDAIYAAILMKATEIEFHLDLQDGEGQESVYGHCWNPQQIEEVITKVKIWHKILHGKAKQEAIDEMRLARTDPSDGARPIKQKEGEEKC